MSDPNLSSFLWSVADLLRCDYKQSEYGKVILPFNVLRRLDCVLEGTKEKVLAERTKREAAGLNPEPFLLRASGQLFYNTLTAEAQHAIDLLQERRSALISAAVIGQIDVRAAVAAP